MLNWTEVAVCSELNTQHVKKFYGHSVKFWNVKPVDASSKQ